MPKPATPLVAILDLRERTALVVGLGPVGCRKAAALLAAGARVLGIDPDPLTRPRAPLGLIWKGLAYHEMLLEGVTLVIAAGPPAVNQMVVADARKRGLWVNSVSTPASGNLTLPATWNDGALTLAVATDGASPGLATALRDRAVAALGPAAARYATLLRELRPLVLARLPEPTVRKQVFRAWADLKWVERLEVEGPAAVRAALLALLPGDPES